jgi:hypothetical protein
VEKVLDGQVERNKQHTTELIRKHDAELAEQVQKHEMEKTESKKREHDLLERQAELEGSNKRLRQELEESGAQARQLESELATLTSARPPPGRMAGFTRILRRVLLQGEAGPAEEGPGPSDPTHPNVLP